MNRSLPALILLLGTLGGSIVALGVARDLERASRRPASHAEVTAQNASFDHGRTTPNVTIRREWLNPAEPTITPLRHRDDVDYVAETIGIWENDWLLQAKSILRRSTEQYRLAEFARKKTVVAPTPQIPPAKSELSVEKRRTPRVPQGYVAVGPDRNLVAVNFRSDAFTGTLLWTGSLHYGGNARQTLGSTVVTTTPIAQAEQPLPWDKLVLWSSDRRAWVARCGRWTAGILQAVAGALESVGTAGNCAAWLDRQVGRSWDRLVTQVKRDLWLVTVPDLAIPMRSAELPQGEKR